MKGQFTWKAQLFIFIVIFAFGDIQSIFPQSGSWHPAYNDNGYANPCSITKGDSIQFHISTLKSPYNVLIYKLGVTEELVATYSNIEGGRRPIPDSVYEKGCGWPVSLSIQIPESWRSGAYAARFPVDSGAGMATIIFYVKEKNPGSIAKLLVVIPYFNYVAYNAFGGKNVYDENSTDSKRAHRVSLNRPLFGGGYAEFRSYPYKMLKWLENNQIDYEIATEMDIHKQPELLSNYKLAIGVGHAEYWTIEERLNVEKYVKAGGKYMSLSGNTCWWQVRLEDNDNTLVCYKNRFLDPLNGVIDSLVTVNWYDAPLNRSEIQFLGASFRYAGYVDDIGHPKQLTFGQGYGGYAVHNSQNWIFANTGLQDGDILGRDPVDSLKTIVGYETDGTLFKWVNGLPEVLGIDQTPKNFRILGISPAIGQGDTSIFRPPIEPNHSTMGIYYNKNGGALFNASSIYWTYGLLKDVQVQTITKNIIMKFMENRFPPEIIGWSPFKLKTDTLNHEVIKVNTREISVTLKDTIKFSVKVQDPYEEKPSYIWYEDTVKKSTDSVYVYISTKENKNAVIKVMVYNSKDTSSIAWQTKYSDPVAVQDTKVPLPYRYYLEQNYPNPFNPETKIKFGLARDGNVKIEIYNIVGQRIEVLLNESRKAGDYEINFKGQDLTSGIYFYKISAPGFSQVKKMVMLK